MASTSKKNFAREVMLGYSLAAPDEYAGAQMDLAPPISKNGSIKRNPNGGSVKLGKYHFAEAEMAPPIPPPNSGVVSKKSGR